MLQDNPCREGYAGGDAMLHKSVTWVTQGLHGGGLMVVRGWYDRVYKGGARATRRYRDCTARTIRRLTIILRQCEG